MGCALVLILANYHNGGKVMIAWNPNSFTITITHFPGQLIHCLGCPEHGSTSFFCFLLYGFNDAILRRMDC